MWDNLTAGFLDRLDEVNAHLAAHGLPAIDKGNSTSENQGLARTVVEGELVREGAEGH
jgi:hypothetical protein